MRPFFFFFLGLLLAIVICIPAAYAGTVDYSKLTNVGGELHYIKPSGATSVLYPDLQTVAVNARLPVTLGTSQGARVPVTIDAVAKKVLTKDVLGKAVVKNMRGGLIGTIGAVASVVDALDLHYDPACNCIVQGTESTTSPTSTSVIEWRTGSIPHGNTCTANMYPSPWASTKTAAISAASSSFPHFSCDGYWKGVGTCSDGGTEATCPGQLYDQNGTHFYGNATWHYSLEQRSVNQDTCTTGTLINGQCLTQPVTKSDTEAIDLIKLHDFPLPDLFNDLISQGDGVDASDIPASPSIEPHPGSDTQVIPDPQQQGQGQIKSPTRVTDNGNGTRTEEKTTVNYNTQGDTITYNVTNQTTVINNSTGQVVDSATETNTGGQTNPTQPDTTYSDTPLPEKDLLVQMPEVPDFYTQKYPDGFATPWNQFKTDIDQSSFMQVIHQLTPNWTGGECPSWQIGMDLGIANFGTATIEPPCWVFPILKIILIVTALFVARGLIFGG